MTPNTAPAPLGVDELLPLLAALRAPATVPADASVIEAVLHLSHGLAGAAEIQAIAAELAARAAGADHPQIQAAAGEAFAAAGADSRTDVLGHFQWRAMRPCWTRSARTRCC